MSKELDDLYRETLERIRKQPGEDGTLGMRVLSWITHTRRPLSVEELRHGLAVEYDDIEEPDGDFDPENLLSPRSLVDVCAGLVVIDPRSQNIRLVHYTTQEFFNKERLHLFEDAENDISMACLTYLSYSVFSGFSSERLISETLRLYPFLAYAVLNWVLHISSIETSAAAWSKALLYVNDSERMEFSSMILRKLLLRSRSYSRLTEMNDDFRVRAAPLPLECASECGQLLLVRFILNYAKGSEVALDSSLHCASAEGHAQVVETLIKSGAKATSLSSDSSSALLKACKGGHLEAARLLVKYGANTNTPDRWMWTPLHYAAHGSHAALVAFLIGNGSSSNAQTPLGMTPCHLAASRGDIETVKILIDSNFDLKLTTRDKRTVLHSAAEAGHLNVVRLLLASGSDALAKDRNGCFARDLVQDSDSVEVKGIFWAYMEALLGYHDDIQSTDEMIDESTQPFSKEREETVVLEPEVGEHAPHHVPRIGIMEVYSPEVPTTSSEEEAGPYIRDAPRLILVEPTPPSSPTGSDTNKQAA